MVFLAFPSMKLKQNKEKRMNIALFIKITRCKPQAFFPRGILDFSRNPI